MINKRGQITFFIVIGVLIAAAVIGFVAVKTNFLGIEKESVNPEVQPVYSFVESCIQETGEDAVYSISQIGGYYIVPGLSNDLGIAYYLYENENKMPSKEKIEQEIADYIRDNVYLCTSDLDYGNFIIEIGNISVTTTVEERAVVITAEYPVKVSTEDKSYSFEKFSTEVQVRLGVVYGAIEKIMEKQMEDRSSICLNCLSAIYQESGLGIKMLDYKQEEVIFTVEDEYSLIDEEPLRFNFVNKYQPIELYS